MNEITYHYRGGTERGTGTGYEWRNGYSENTESGAITYPWMTFRECQADARKRGARAVFTTFADKHRNTQPQTERTQAV